MLAHAGNSPTTLVETLIEALEARDSYTASHGLRVAEYAVAIAKELSAPHDDLHALQLGASLHDIGKIGIPDAILLKPGHLTENEQNLMQLHTRFGRKILRRIGGFESVLAIVELHHENFDGSGYPFGLGGEKIPLPARIVRVADAFDAMTTDRVYRPAFTFETAIEHIRSEGGRQFDPMIARAFETVLNANTERYLTMLALRLSENTTVTKIELPAL